MHKFFHYRTDPRVDLKDWHLQVSLSISLSFSLSLSRCLSLTHTLSVCFTHTHTITLSQTLSLALSRSLSLSLSPSLPLSLSFSLSPSLSLALCVRARVHGCMLSSYVYRCVCNYAHLCFQQAIPDEVFDNKLGPRVTLFDFSQNQLAVLPAMIDSMTCLREVEIFKSQLPMTLTT